MNTTQSLNYQINRAGFWSAIVFIITAVVSVFFPLDIPEGYSAEHADRVAWLSENRGAFIAGWVNQIVAMLSLSGVFFAIAWKVAANNQLRAILAAMVVLMSVFVDTCENSKCHNFLIFQAIFLTFSLFCLNICTLSSEIKFKAILDFPFK